ncbi:excalibur calcium-binding domain-containing protein [Hyphomicrobium sp. 1Nfss2.1]|uniref:excalibur calcium-binding domain-containing protein n=1 Tax=Hyphomicrobium sp. 1Nfss2.1 TaxID=3413936 RepID=UPI003C79E67E
MPPHATRIAVLLLSLVVVMPAHAFDCAEKLCGQMMNCAEAYYHLSACGEGARDADNDGIPCENVCGKTMDEYLRRRGPTLPGMTAPLPKSDGVPDGAEETQSFICAGKRKCGEMQSCAEARFYLTTCGVRALDRDKDGVPCESLCGGR